MTKYRQRIRSDETGVSPRATNDHFGRMTVDGAITLVTPTRITSWTRGLERLVHRVPNGVNDALTFYHLVYRLANIESNRYFTAGQLAAWLNFYDRAFVWDAVSVGRILNDLRDCWLDVNPHERFQPLQVERRTAARYYRVSDYPEARIAMLNLLDDLLAIGRRLVKEEDRGRFPQRLMSPLNLCPSLVAPIEAALELAAVDRAEAVAVTVTR
jgi:hypothetical protein